MSERNWTVPQRAAIDTRDRTLLVSAAAGSGKTAVLTERIIRSLTDEEHPADISRMLIVTFTRAAAAQLRQKISAALSKRLALDPHNAHLNRQLMLLGGAHISTIDSFYMEVVKANFQASGLSPNFRMADDTELAALRREVMNEVIDEMYARTERFSALADIFCDIRNEASLCNALLDVAERLEQYPESIDILTRSADEMTTAKFAFLNTGFGRVWVKTVTELAKTGAILFEAALSEMQSEDDAFKLERKFGAHYREVLERCRDILETVQKYENERDDEADPLDAAHYSLGLYGELQLLLAAPFSTEVDRSRPKMSEEFVRRKTLCDNFLKKWKSSAADWGANDATVIQESATESAEMLRLLHQALSLYKSKYDDAKGQREIAEFSDISRAAYRMLVEKDGTPTALAREIASGFDAVYIDEYQDVNAMQDATFRAVSTPRNRFMVGDIKQSIYRFRGAQPNVFADYRKAFPLLENAEEGAESSTVFMSNCFRCDDSVIRFSNAVSGFLFSRSADSIGYTAADDLVFSKSPEKSGKELCEVMVLETMRATERGERVEGAVLEARMIAQQIDRLLNGGKKADGTPVRPGDIAILSRTASHFPQIARELNALGIPTNDSSKQSFFENPEVLCTYSLLVCVDNPLRDIHLAAALRSPFFGFTLGDLLTLRAAGDSSLSLYESVCKASEAGISDPVLAQKTTDFLTRLATFREKARVLPVDKLLRYLYRETAVLALAGYEEDGSGRLTRRTNLNRLYEYARKFESGGFKGLHQFIRYIDNVMQSGAKLPHPEGDTNAVLLTTIHGSKGLEFPICFLASAQTAFSKNDFSPAMLSDEYLGCALRLSNAGPFSRCDTFFRSAVEMELRRQSREEEMRILYVGMTRAIEKLYVTAAITGKTDTVTKKAKVQATPSIGEFAFDDNYLGWILAALERPDAKNFAIVRYLTEETLEQADHGDVPLPQGAEEPPCAEDTTDFERTVCDRFDFVYPYAHLSRLPAKLSVSRLSPVALDVYDNDGSPSPIAVESEEAQKLLHVFDRAPVFGEKEPSAAEKGTATHEFLQFCDFENAKRIGVAAELDRLIEARFLAPSTKKAVRINELERFFQSRFFDEISNAVTLRREVRFHIFLPACDFTEDAAFKARLTDEMLAIQGVIDLFYTDAEGNLVLCDYKTDRLTPYELQHPDAAARSLTERHGKQLAYYAKALERICGKPPHKILIYSLPLGEAVEIDLPQ